MIELCVKTTNQNQVMRKLKFMHFNVQCSCFANSMQIEWKKLLHCSPMCIQRNCNERTHRLNEWASEINEWNRLTTTTTTIARKNSIKTLRFKRFISERSQDTHTDREREWKRESYAFGTDVKSHQKSPILKWLFRNDVIICFLLPLWKCLCNRWQTHTERRTPVYIQFVPVS